MRLLRAVLIGLSTFALSVVLTASAASAEKRVALVIGNAAYKHAPALKNPKNDAEDMAVALKRLGFTVISGVDLDERGMAQKARDFSRALEGADVGLLFYAGHGLQAKGVNFLVPVDASLKAEGDLEFETLSLDRLMKLMQTQARVTLVMLDACRDNPLARGLKSASRSGGVGTGLARVEEAAGTMIAFSTQPGNVALDGTGRNSPFTKALLTHIETPGASVSDVMIDVRKMVMAETGEKQVPWENSSLTGKFYFKPGAAITTASTGGAAPSTTQQPVQKEVLTVADRTVDHTFWTSVAGSNDPALYREYLTRFPNGTYAAIAQARLQAWAAPTAPPQKPEPPQQVAMLPGGAASDPARAMSSPPPSPRMLAEDMQRELKRVGCYSGSVDGDWGQGSRKALGRFNEQTGLALQTEQPTIEAANRIRTFTAAVCSKTVAEDREEQPARKKASTSEERDPPPRKRASSSEEPPRRSSSGGAGDAAAGAFVGGVVGGIIGSQIGRRR
jgi:uncharacterized caspase-like protein